MTRGVLTADLPIIGKLTFSIRSKTFYTVVWGRGEVGWAQREASGVSSALVPLPSSSLFFPAESQSRFFQSRGLNS